MGDAHGEDRSNWLAEDEAHRLLARAVELDTKHGAAVSVVDLQHAADEAGIGRAAFDQALDELRSGALEPVTIGQRVSAKFAEYRGPGALVAFVSAAGITPGDALGLTLLLGFGLYGAYEGVIALARLLGTTPPRIPPGPRRDEVVHEKEGSRDWVRDRTDMRFATLARFWPLGVPQLLERLGRMRVATN